MVNVSEVSKHIEYEHVEWLSLTIKFLFLGYQFWYIPSSSNPISCINGMIVIRCKLYNYYKRFHIFVTYSSVLITPLVNYNNINEDCFRNVYAVVGVLLYVSSLHRVADRGVRHS